METYFLKKGEYKEENTKNMMEVGKMYSGFLYPQPKYKDELDFYNTFPTVLCIGYFERSDGKRNPLVLNMNFIPPKIRILILDKIMRTFNSTVQQNYTRIANGKKSTKVLPAWYKVLKIILKRSGFEFSIRSYIPSRMKGKPQIISYSDYWKLFFISNKFMVKLSQRQIYILYKINLNSSYKIGTKDKKISLNNNKISDLKKLLKAKP
jgi:hypothetical protein